MAKDCSFDIVSEYDKQEVVNAVVKIIDNRVLEDRDTTIDEILEIIQGPDFPTGAQILGRSGIEEAYRTGRGKIKVRAISEIEPMNGGKQRIVVTELPYMVNKAKLIQKIAELVKEKKMDGITALRDESSREGMRIVIELRHDVNANLLLNNLYIILLDSRYCHGVTIDTVTVSLLILSWCHY